MQGCLQTVSIQASQTLSYSRPYFFLKVSIMTWFFFKCSFLLFLFEDFNQVYTVTFCTMLCSVVAFWQHWCFILCILKPKQVFLDPAVDEQHRSNMSTRICGILCDWMHCTYSRFVFLSKKIFKLMVVIIDIMFHK